MPKSMIFLFDGTGKDASEDRFSNVYAINQLIADRKTVRVHGRNSIKTQITFYLPGDAKIRTGSAVHMGNLG